MDQAWKDFQELIDMDPPTSLAKYLGCEHEVGTKTVNNSRVNTVTYVIKDFSQQCVPTYLSLINETEECLRKVAMPF